MSASVPELTRKNKRVLELCVTHDLNTPSKTLEVNKTKGRYKMTKLYTKKSMRINFNNKNKGAIAHKRKKESLIFASLISEAYAQLTY